jgi:imidazolonepropionase-like amidohydrolase
MKRLLLLVLFAVPAFAETIHWRNGLWFDGSGFRSRSFYSVDGELTTKKPKTIDQTIDLHGRYVVPPFGDAHHHGIDSAAGLDEKIRSFLDAGVFYVKNPNVIPDLLTADVRAKLNHPGTIDVAFSNGGLTKSGGHPVGLHAMLSKRGIFPGLTPTDMPNHAYFTIDNGSDLEEKWPLILAGTPDFIKTFVLFSGTAKSEGLEPEVLAAIVKRAHGAGLRVSTHIETAADFRVAVDAGVDEINHLPIVRGADVTPYAIDDTTAQLAAKKKITVVTTLRPIRMPGAPQGAPRANVIALQLQNITRLTRAGVALALGSDGISGEQPFATARDEALYLHEHGLADNLALLKMWTETTAHTIFPSRKIGALRDGYEASFLVLDGDPLKDFANVTKIMTRVKQGRVLHSGA